MTEVFRETWKRPRLWMFDAVLFFFFVPVVFHPRLWSIGLFFLVAAALAAAENIYGFGLIEALRALRLAVLGNHRPARPAIRRRRLVDYQQPPENNFFD